MELNIAREQDSSKYNMENRFWLLSGGWISALVVGLVHLEHLELHWGALPIHHHPLHIHVSFRIRAPRRSVSLNIHLLATAKTHTLTSGNTTAKLREKSISPDHSLFAY